ncbi:heme-binding protein [Enterovibrio makurazakiensis]|uniref:Heme-binding protein n=1 Tax=Enterovibrio gelatinilyticus TaxID=2899819 RepID=A0ABT5QWD5_9GAMM|nr:heme-binding protein [Enterovibrio sp. ZSDZ42]MDD1792328.1 heme-binding protein [Enterovibrio sp. ZSDZ42]
MENLTMTNALDITDQVFLAAQNRNTAPLTVAILDKGGALISLQRQDGSSMMRPEIAIGKAWGALALGCSSRKIADDAQARPSFISSVSTLAHGNLVPVPGGVLIRDQQSTLLGAVGVSGDISDTDEEVAIAGIIAAHFSTDHALNS